MESKKGSLVVVGTGIKSIGQMTQESIAWIKLADKVLYVVTDAVGEATMRRLNPNVESLQTLYEEGKNRMITYREMIDRMVECVHQGMRTCAVYYGHPGVYAYPTHAAIKRLRKEGYEAIMLPGVSAEDCMIADLGVDPGTFGCQSYEATAFVVHQHTVNPTAALILWQVGTFGNIRYSKKLYELKAISALIEHMANFYPMQHEVCIYEASAYPNCPPRIDWCPLDRLHEQVLTSASTLYVPPAKKATTNRDLLERLGLRIVEEPFPAPHR